MLGGLRHPLNKVRGRRIGMLLRPLPVHPESLHRIKAVFLLHTCVAAHVTKMLATQKTIGQQLQLPGFRARRRSRVGCCSCHVETRPIYINIC